jgi:hypothetical protein
MDGRAPDPQPAPAIDVAKLRALLPDLGSVGLAAAAAAPQVPRGRVLKLKLGFNPNSSSVGTTVVVFLWSLVASGAVLALTSAVLAYRAQRKRGTGPSPRPDGAEPVPDGS